MTTWTYSIQDRDTAYMAPVENIPGGWNGPTAEFDRNPTGITEEESNTGTWEWVDPNEMYPAKFVWRATTDEVVGDGWMSHDTFHFFPNDDAIKEELEDYGTEIPDSREELYEDFKYAK